MKCPTCGAELTDQPTPKFCNYCGSPIPEEQPAEDPGTYETALPQEDPVPAAPEETPFSDPDSYFEPSVPVSEPVEPPVPPAPPVMPPVQKKKKGHGGFIAAIIILAVLFAAAATFGVLAFLEIRDDRATIDLCNEQIENDGAALSEAEEEALSLGALVDGYEEDIEEMGAQLKEQDDTIADLQENLDDLSASADEIDPILHQYNDIFDYVADSGFGWASENFHATGSIALLRLDGGTSELSFNLVFTESADEPITVHWETSNDCIKVTCNAESLADETPFTITGLKEGISVVHFYNDYNDESFNILVVVTE